ncbi:MAG: chlorophyll synthase ChlG, partial [Microcystis sp.]
MSNSPSSESANSGAKARQLLGMKGAASGETSIWKIRLQ